MTVSKTCWIFIVIVLLTTFKSCECESWTFEIERFSGRKQDVIPNDFEISSQGHWKKLKHCQKNCHNSTTGFNTNLQCPSSVSRNKCCSCGCSYGYSTFRMDATARSSFCVKNEVLRFDAGCRFTFTFQGTSNAEPIPVLELENSHNNKYKIKPPDRINQNACRCYVQGKAQYWHAGEWKDVTETNLFTVYNGHETYFKWKTTDNYEGRIMRQSLQCNSTTQKISSTSCIVFKVLGTLQYTVDDNPRSTTMKPSTVATTKQPKTMSTTAGVSTYQTTSQILTSSVATSTVTTTSHVETTAPTYHTPTSGTQYSTKPDTTTGKIFPTKESEMPATKITEQSTTETDVVPGKKGARGASSDSDDGDNTIMIAAIGASAAIACVIIICIFLWFVVKRKQNNRNNEAYSTDMTVITNGTGMNNNLSAPTLKNPIYDNTTYCEPTEKNHPKQLPKLGNPVYDKAIISNNKSHQNNKKPSHKPKPKYDSNHYDNKDDDEAYDNPGYQDLIVKQGNNAVNDDSTYDNTYAEPEKPVYEALSTNSGRDSIYQPLMHNNQSTETVDTPEYLALVHENTRPEEQEIPEYLTLVDDDESNQTQPETPEYDYTYAHTPEKRTTLKAPSTKGAGISQQDPHVYGTLQGPNHQSPPVYGVLQNPNDQGPPVYDVLEDPNDQGPPVYDVLEDPNDQGPPVYDVLEDPNNQGPPVYDVLEDPNDIGPPVYDVLEGPDSGDDYLMPVDGQ